MRNVTLDRSSRHVEALADLAVGAAVGNEAGNHLLGRR